MNAIEAAARAIIRQRAAAGDKLGSPLSGAALESYVNKSWQYWTGDASAAILAFLDSAQEPTEEMRDEFARFLVLSGRFKLGPDSEDSASAIMRMHAQLWAAELRKSVAAVE